MPFTPFSLCSHHGIIMKFSGVITNGRSDVYAKVQGQRSKVKVTEVKTPISHFGTIVLQCDFTYGDEMMYKSWYCLGAVPYWFSMSSVKFQGHTAKKIGDLDPNWAFPDYISSLNSQMAMKWCIKNWSSIEQVPYCFSRLSVKFQGHRAKKKSILTQNWDFSNCNSSSNSQMAMKWFSNLEVA